MTHSLPFAEILKVAEAAARAGGAELESWRGRFTVREKARADLVTEADVASQRAIQQRLAEAFPDYGFVGEEDAVGRGIEETRPAAGGPPVWVVDPLDGTVNYAHDVPAYCVSVGLYHAGRAVAGVIYDPRLEELFSAAVGYGATLNGKPIRVSSCGRIEEALLSTGFPSGAAAQARNLGAWQSLSGRAQALRRTGSTALNLAYVAAGRFDGYWAYDNYAWDVMAGAILVEEAGGTVTDAHGQLYDPFRMDMVAATSGVHGAIVAAIRHPG